MYKLVNLDGKLVCIQQQIGNVLMSIPIDPANTDYQNFKKQINADEAQLLDADGNLMTAEQAKEFVATLP